jgi:RNA polymerase sigma-70 factor (ECF subfamily)
MTNPPDDWTQRLERFRPYLGLLARLHLGQFGPQLQSKLDGADLVQMTLLEAYQARHRFKGDSERELAAWLRQILKHQFAHAVRDLGREKRDVNRERSLDAALEESSARLGAWLAADQSTPSEQAESREEGVLLAEALDRLPQEQREALIPYYLQGVPMAEIAGRLGRTEAATASLIWRGVQKLKKLLSQRE